jgi:hypothetical protein
MAFDVVGTKLTFEFDSEEAANHFKLWMCESGEQGYWEWMEYRENEDDTPNITGIHFSYHNKDSHIVPVKCGRLDKER